MKRNWYNHFSEFARAFEEAMLESQCKTIADEFRTSFDVPKPPPMWAIDPDGHFYSPAGTVKVSQC